MFSYWFVQWHNWSCMLTMPTYSYLMKTFAVCAPKCDQFWETTDNFPSDRMNQTQYFFDNIFILELNVGKIAILYVEFWLEIGSRSFKRLYMLTFQARKLLIDCNCVNNFFFPMWIIENKCVNWTWQFESMFSARWYSE